MCVEDWTDGCCRLAKDGKLDRLADVVGCEDVLKENSTTGSSERESAGGHGGVE